MSLSAAIDPDLAAAAAQYPDFRLDDVDEARRTFDAMLSTLEPVDTSGIAIEEWLVPGAPGGPEIPIRLFVPDTCPDGNFGSRAVVLEIHGGGFVLGSAEQSDAVNAVIARSTGAVVVSVDYRLAPEHPYPAAVDDCYAALSWIASSAAHLDIDPDRIVVVGDSSGGSLAASIALRARDAGGPPIALQVLLEPELDDRLETASMRGGVVGYVWDSTQAALSWRHYLGEQQPTGESVPARQLDLAGLPPTYITVNEHDPLRDEGLEYAQRLQHAGVPVELHLWPGAFHGFALVRGAAATRRANTSLCDSIIRATAKSAVPTND